MSLGQAKKTKRTKLTIFTKYVSSLSADNYLDWLRARGKAWQLWPDSEFGWATFDQWSSQAHNYKGEHETRELFFNFGGNNWLASSSNKTLKKGKPLITSAKIEAFLSKCKNELDTHPYICNKRIYTNGLYRYNELLIVPLVDINGEYVSLQMISPKGNKRFLKGASTRGAFFREGHFFIPEAVFHYPVFIAEGYATACSILLRGGCIVLAAMSAGNLGVVAAEVRKKYPNSTIIIAADNDAAQGGGNIGLETARKLVTTVADSYVVPVLDQNPSIKCDFSDVYMQESEQTMMDQLKKRYNK